jgi:hypothetical protein
MYRQQKKSFLSSKHIQSFALGGNEREIPVTVFGKDKI